MRPCLTLLTILCLASHVTFADAQTKTTTPAAAPTTSRLGMNNTDVVKMVKAGLSEVLIIAAVKRTESREFDLSASGLVALKVGGATDSVIAAMLELPTSTVSKVVAAHVPTVVSAAADKIPSAPRATDLPPSLEVGVYYQRSGAWTEVLPEVVNWKTGGVLKHLASGGLIKGDVNGMVAGARSRTSVKSPAELLVYTPETVAITEYQLLWLRPQSNSREFRTVTGGVLHASGGSTRDLVDFESKKLAVRTHKILLPDLEPGEYGLLPPGATATSSASAQLGKIYTFHVD
jgi:hypothetical protein